LSIMLLYNCGNAEMYAAGQRSGQAGYRALIPGLLQGIITRPPPAQTGMVRK
jgi:hypothetical protein